jgi:hypothetical protein
MIFLRGKQLTSMYKPCYLDAQASSSATPEPAAHRQDAMGRGTRAKALAR